MYNDVCSFETRKDIYIYIYIYYVRIYDASYTLRCSNLNMLKRGTIDGEKENGER